MKTKFAAVFAFLAVAVNAAPASIAARDTTVTISLTNDQTGNSVAVSLPADGEEYCMTDIVVGVSIQTSGPILASSAQLIQFPQGVTCAILDVEETTIGILSSETTWVDLDDNSSAAIPQDISNFFIICAV